jgi:hypothetical protein
MDKPFDLAQDKKTEAAAAKALAARGTTLACRHYGGNPH